MITQEIREKVNELTEHLTSTQKTLLVSKCLKFHIVYFSAIYNENRSNGYDFFTEYHKYSTPIRFFTDDPSSIDGSYFKIEDVIKSAKSIGIVGQKCGYVHEFNSMHCLIRAIEFSDIVPLVHLILKIDENALVEMISDL